ncbi:MAG: asparagine synthase-related protein [Gemmatimonadota bacterium]|jgi:asparagine synthase (glutamine-hydrolysing)
MSGICALLRLDGAPVRARQLEPVLDALEGWGGSPALWPPDGEPLPVALGCRVAAVTPEDAFEHQPLRSADGACTLVADARIDNRTELAGALGIRGVDAARMPDSAFVLAAYEAWGDDCPRHLDGDFAFLLWDGRRRTLLAARDAIGQRALFHHRRGPWLSIASMPAALTTLEHVPAALNEEKIADFLVLMQDPESTFFRDVHRLPAGCLMLAGPENVRVRHYWQMLPPRELRLGSDGAYLEAFREVFDEAVRARLRSASPVGIMLSAGLDSSTVGAVAAKELRSTDRTLVAFHAAPRAGAEAAVRAGWVADESDDVRAIARLHENIDLTVMRPDGRLPFDGLDTMFARLGMPIRNASNRAWVEAINTTAAQRGIGVLLSGQKGNATISYTGLRSLRDMARAGQWAPVLRELRAVARRTGQDTRAVVRQQILLAFAPRGLLRAWARLKRTPAEPVWESRFSAIRPEFARTMRVEERLAEQGSDDLSTSRLDGLGYRAAVLSAGDALDWTHAARAWFGVETRDPTSDRRVVEFCLGIPGSQYLRDGRGRMLVRRSMRGLVPDTVLERDSRGAQASDWSEWLPAMRPGLERDMARIEQSETARRCIDVPRLRSLLAHWPETLRVEHMGDYNHRLLRGVMMGRFITWFEETFE